MLIQPIPATGIDGTTQLDRNGLCNAEMRSDSVCFVFFCFRTVHAEQCNGSVHYQYIAKIRKYHAIVTPTLARSCACSAHRRIVDASPLIATPTKVFDWFHIALHVGWAKRVLNK